MYNRSVYAGIENAVPLRKDILNTSISLIALLEKYEHIKEIRANKQNEILYLKNLLKEIKDSLSEYKTNLPWLKEKEEEKKHKGRKKEKVRKAVKLKLKKIEKKKGMTELDKLKNELGILKGKLANIDNL